MEFCRYAARRVELELRHGLPFAAEPVGVALADAAALPAGLVYAACRAIPSRLFYSDVMVTDVRVSPLELCAALQDESLTFMEGLLSCSSIW